MTNKAKFFAEVRHTLFNGRLTKPQVEGMEAILNATTELDRRWVAYMLATAYHETGKKMQPVEENLNYSASGLLKTFPKYFTPMQAASYARAPVRIANRAYANRMGNGDEASGDGWKYRGRGIIQITGKRNYDAFAKWLELDINPDDVAINLTLAVKAGVWFWLENEIASLNSVEKVTRRINGGLNGLDDRVNLYRKLMA